MQSSKINKWSILLHKTMHTKLFKREQKSGEIPKKIKVIAYGVPSVITEWRQHNKSVLRNECSLKADMQTICNICNRNGWPNLNAPTVPCTQLCCQMCTSSSHLEVLYAILFLLFHRVIKMAYVCLVPERRRFSLSLCFIFS